MNLFQSSCLGCLAQPYFHIYFNKWCTVGTTNPLREAGRAAWVGRVNWRAGIPELGLGERSFSLDHLEYIVPERLRC